MEMTFENWLGWKWYRETNALTNEAIGDKTHKYHKMAACTKMSRKRFVKLLMATGKTDKRGAERIADEVHRKYRCYLDFWYWKCYGIIRNIDSRYVTIGENKKLVLHRVFGCVLQPGMMPVSPWWWTDEGEYSKANWQKDKELLESHPGITCYKELAEYEGSRMKEMCETHSFDVPELTAIKKLSSWFRWAEEQEKKKEKAGNG